MNWSALALTLDITTEMRPVYRAGKRGFLTKDAAESYPFKEAEK